MRGGMTAGNPNTCPQLWYIYVIIAAVGGSVFGFVLGYKLRDLIRRLFSRRNGERIRLLQSSKDDEISELQTVRNQLIAEKERYRVCLEEEREQNKALSLRLSEIMSDKMRHNNPNITDLSDENRPVKIVEKFSELYDNQWTDAYDALGELETKEKILLKILMTIYKKCQEVSEQQISHLKECCCVKEHEKLPAEIEVKVLTERKRKALDWLDDILEKTKTHLNEELLGAPWQQLLQTKEMESYLSECTKLCWLMSVQTPPVTLEAEVGESCILDKELFKEYTKAGKYVEYVVWPRMLLHKNGPFLAKGVAQGWNGDEVKFVDERKGSGSNRKDGDEKRNESDFKAGRAEEDGHGAGSFEESSGNSGDSTSAADGGKRKNFGKNVTSDQQGMGGQAGINLDEISVSMEKANVTEQSVEQYDDLQRQDHGNNHTDSQADQAITGSNDSTPQGDGTEGDQEKVNNVEEISHM